MLGALLAACGGGGMMTSDASSAQAAAGSVDMPATAGAPAASRSLGGSGASGAAANSTSFADVYDRVIRVRCGACHNDAPRFGGLAFFPGGATTAYMNLVGVPAGQDSQYKCHDSGLLRVAPGDPEHSLIYLKLTAPPCGGKMPPAAFGGVADEQVELVRQWIASGAAP